MRWTGHLPTKAVPYTDFRGHGALGWYRYNQGDRLVIGDGNGRPVAIDDDFELDHRGDLHLQDAGRDPPAPRAATS